MVKCAECGYLAVRMNSVGRGLGEAEQQYRDHGSVPQTGSGPAFDNHPVCFKLAAIFHKECTSLDRDGVTEWINRERDCESFTPWHQGYTPREHEEMLERKLMLDWQGKRDEADRNWRDQQAREDRQWREDEAKRASSRHLHQLLVMGFLMILAQIFAGWLSRDRTPESSSPPSAQVSPSATQK